MMGIRLDIKAEFCRLGPGIKTFQTFEGPDPDRLLGMGGLGLSHQLQSRFGAESSQGAEGCH